jgi:hypothetical protein
MIRSLCEAGEGFCAWDYWHRCILVWHLKWAEKNKKHHGVGRFNVVLCGFDHTKLVGFFHIPAPCLWGLVRAGKSPVNMDVFHWESIYTLWLCQNSY